MPRRSPAKAATAPESPPLSSFDHIALDRLDIDPQNIRRHPVAQEAEAAFFDSVADHGVLMPILVRPLGNRFQIVGGARRYRAAQAAGLPSIPAYIRPMDDAQAALVQFAENTARTAIAAVDQWRGMKRLADEHGWTFEAIIRGLALPQRLARRMQQLSRMDDRVLDAIATHGEPHATTLRAVSLAPHEVQRRAIDQATKGRNLDWTLVHSLCDSKKIPRTRARFDAEDPACPVLFTQDFFAEPGSAEEWQTDDIGGFLREQRAWLKAEVDCRAKTERIQLVPYDAAQAGPGLPLGWKDAYKPRTDLKPIGLRSKAMRFICVQEVGWTVGEIHQLIAEPEQTKVHAPPEDQSETGTGTSMKPARNAFSLRGQDAVAQAKTIALKQSLGATAMEQRPPRQVAALLVLAMCADNITIREAGTSLYGTQIRLQQHAARLLDEHALLRVDLTDEMVAEVAAEVMATILAIGGPSQKTASGDAAEWIGRSIGAEAALPRFDTPEFLAQTGGDVLRAVAVEQGVIGAPTAAKMTVANLRAACVGRLPSWRPVSFEPAGPVPAAEAEPDEDAAEAA